MICDSRHILGTRIDSTTYEDAASQILAWSAERRSRIVCAANTHMLMEAHDDPEFAAVLAQADLVTPDGMPLVLGLRALGVPKAQRVYGPDLALHVCRQAEVANVAVGLYGTTTDMLDKVAACLNKDFPDLKIVCRIAPPYRPLTCDEDEAFTTQIIASGCRILLVGLGCPKQEKWMHAHRQTIPAVMIGVGAAFNFFAGQVPQAPPYMQKLCLEWLFRLCMEPRRLWRRYLKHNPRFAILFLRQWLQSRRAHPKESP